MLADALHAVGAFLHDAAAADGHVRIAHELELGRLPVLEEQEVESPHLIGTVIRAVARADAAVVDHVVQAFARVNGRLYRTNKLAGRVFALHARDRLEETLGIVTRPVVISVDAQPVHVAALERLLFADDRNIVFRLAGDDAVVASDAGIQVDRHAPRVRFLLVGKLLGLIEREIFRRLFFLREVRLFLVFLETALHHERAFADGSLHRLIALRAGELIDAADGSQLRSAREPRRLAGTQRIDVEPGIGADAAGAGASVAEKYGNRIIGMAGLNPDRAFYFLAIEFEFGNVFEIQFQPLGHCRADHDGVVPSELGQRLWKFL